MPPSSAILRVFVSSTSEDLAAFRDAARQVILDAGWHPVMMEHFGTAPEVTIEACQRRAAECDLLLLLVGFRRGWVPSADQGGDGRRSITAYEFEAARRAQRPVLVFLAHETWPGNLWEQDDAGRAWVRDFRADLNRLAVFFNHEPPPLAEFRSKLRLELARHKEFLLQQAPPEPSPRKPRKRKKEPGPATPGTAPAAPPAAAPLERPEFRYARLYTVASLTLPYIVLIDSWEKGDNEYRAGDLDVHTAPAAFQLPAAFKDNPASCYSDVGKCRLERLGSEIISPGSHRLVLTFSQISYLDYLKSGEYLDAPLPGQPGRTFRDEFAPRIDATREFGALPLTNICGAGLFVLTRDNDLLVSKHSGSVRVLPEIWSYSASGTLDWSDHPHPFREVARESREEIAHNPSQDGLRLFAVGIDAKKLYFQFSFFERTARSTREILSRAQHAADFQAEIEQLVAVPFELNAVVDWLKEKPWEPAAAAGLLTLCAKEFGIDRLEEALDPEFVRQRWKEEMEAEWGQRARRPGDQAIMSARYPAHRVAEESQKYAAAVRDFLGDDVRDRDVLEVGAGTGRLTRHLARVARRLTCIDLSEEMLRRNRELLGDLAARVDYRCLFAQDYQPAVAHDVVISSLVLIHNVEDHAFGRLVDMMCACAGTAFLFEHADPTHTPTPHTRPRSEQELLQAFQGYRVEKRSQYQLFGDRLVFLKLVRETGKRPAPSVATR